MKVQRLTIAVMMATVVLAGCVSRPKGPTVAVMPGPNKPFDAFQADDYACKSWADQQIGSSDESANNKQIGAGVLGMVLGAGLGAAIGGGEGAAIGAGGGALGGTMVGTGNTQHNEYSLQQRYNIAYQQCMYSKGNQVPGFAATAPATVMNSPTVTPGAAAPAGGSVTPSGGTVTPAPGGSPSVTPTH